MRTVVFEDMTDSQFSGSELESMQGNIDMSMSDSNKKKTGRKSRPSKYQVLDEKFESKFSLLDEKLDRLANILLNKNVNTANGVGSCSTTKGANSEGLSQRHTDSEEDELSLNPGQEEVRGVFSDSEHETTKVSDNCISEVKTQSLTDIFGDDALAKKSDKDVGIKLDDAQREVLKGNWRSDSPNLITAFAEEYKELFPIESESEKFLQVPALDDLVEDTLIRRHGKKAGFIRNARHLYSQPYKMVEKTAYRGQQAAYLGIIINLYIQQGLASLMSVLKEDVCDMDQVRKQVRDIFAMSTKTLDQFGRCGAFHHIIRRQVTMTDTHLYEFDDLRRISNLPLNSEGVFGNNLENTLKVRREKHKNLDDLLKVSSSDKKSSQGQTEKRKSDDYKFVQF
ncbi:hypothetical protein KUTeg_025029 [Tegillarca granosa]|uniref:Uncharacterized protein n=1 Tax=Tegillarca granosa TaxID=220873 RepID=A0ABQ9E5B7_TEGGR|nr:hypothetical protein KUTeg_025029 [Tegillarca granosa]